MSAPPPPPPNYPPQAPQPGYGQYMQVPQQPGYTPVMAPPKKSNTTLIIVVVVVVIALVLVVIPMMLYLMVASTVPINNPNTIPPTMVLQGSGSWATSGGGNLSTYTFTVTAISPTSANINPADLQYIVSNSASTVMYSGAAGQSSTSAGFVINVVFQDSLDAGRASQGDRIQVTVSPAANNPLIGGRIQVNFNSASLSTGSM